MGELRVHGDDRVTQHSEIGAGRNFIHLIVGFVSLFVKFGCRHRSKVSSGGESHHTDSFRVDVILDRLTACEAHGALDVGKLSGEVILARSQAVVQNKSSDTEAVVKLSDLMAFMIERKSTVSTTGTDDNGSAIAFFFVRQIDIDERLILAGVAMSKGRALRPEGNVGEFFRISS